MILWGEWEPRPDSGPIRRVVARLGLPVLVMLAGIAWLVLAAR